MKKTIVLHFALRHHIITADGWNLLPPASAAIPTHDTMVKNMDQLMEYQRSMMNGFVGRFVKRMQVANTCRALQGLDDRTLRDLGIHRAQIKSYVNEMYTK